MADPPVKVLYLLGPARSGSTLLGNVLGEMDGVLHAGELRFLWSRGLLRGGLCGCGRKVGECPLWSPVAGAALDGREARRVHRALLGTARLRHIPRNLGDPAGPPLDDLRGVLGALYREAAGRTGSRVVVDSSKDPAYGAVVATLPGIRPHFLHLVRDPRATAYSWKRPKPRDRRGDLMPRRGPVRSAAAWLIDNAASTMVAKNARAPAMRLRYEDLVARPRAAVERVIRFLDEAPAPSSFADDHSVLLGPNHTVSGNPGRFRTGRVEVREDDRWRTGLGDLDRLVVTAVASPLLLRYGYPLRPARRPAGLPT